MACSIFDKSLHAKKILAALNYDHFLSLAVVILSLRAPNPKYRREAGAGQISKSDSNGKSSWSEHCDVVSRRSVLRLPGYTQPKELGRLQAGVVSDPSELSGHLLPYFKS